MINREKDREFRLFYNKYEGLIKLLLLTSFITGFIYTIYLIINVL